MASQMVQINEPPMSIGEALLKPKEEIMARIERKPPEGQYAKGVVKHPRVPAFLTKDGSQLRIWCCWCDSWHHHGAGSRDDEEYPLYGHRVAHCDTASPYRETGYVLTDPATLEKLR